MMLDKNTLLKPRRLFIKGEFEIEKGQLWHFTYKTLQNYYSNTENAEADGKEMDRS